MKRLMATILSMGLLPLLVTAQQKPVADSAPRSRILDINPRFVPDQEDTWLLSGICKPLRRMLVADSNGISLKKDHKSFLKIHGNIQYDFLYRSLVDTPFYQKDFQQHTVKTNFNLLFSNNYPVQVTVLHRNSNSNYFRDITDVSVQFSHRDYMTKLRENLVEQSIRFVNTVYMTALQQAENRYKTRLAEIAEMERWLADPARLQELVAERERILKNMAYAGIRDSLKTKLDLPTIPTVPKLPELPDEEAIKEALAAKAKHEITKEIDSILAKMETWEKEKRKLIADSILNTKTAAYIEKKKKELAAAKKEIGEFESKFKGIKKNIADSLFKLKKEILQLKDPTAISAFIKQKQLDIKEMPKGWKTFAAIRSVNIGRSWVDYSELSVKNISLTGGNIELNPGNFYFALATGRMNYRFRDFVVQNPAQPRQSLFMVRAGIGKKDANNFIISWYDGKRNLLSSTPGSPANVSPERVIGMSAESRLRISDNQFIIAEFAKSSFHTTGTVTTDGQSLFEKVKNFKDHSNEAYSIKWHSAWPIAGTKFTGYYKKLGKNFQSFNLQPVNSNQEAFQVKFQQQLWKKKLTIDAGLRKNDFSNPFITPGMSSSTVFKSVQLSLRIPKYPFVSIGYAPSSQLTVLDNTRIVENQYNTLNAVVSYSYRLRQNSMVTNFTFLKFYNNSSDTGFIYYDATSYALNQLVYLGANWQLQSGLTITDQQDLHVLTWEESLTWQMRNWLSLSGGLKYNRVNRDVTQWGGMAAMNLLIGRLGSIQFGYDRSFLPGTARNLVPVDMGRMSYYRSF